MTIRALPNPFPFGNILHPCKDAPAVWSSGIVRDTALYGTGLKVVFKCCAGLVFEGFVGNLIVAVFLETSCEERMFCDVYDTRIDVIYIQAGLRLEMMPVWGLVNRNPWKVSRKDLEDI